MALGPVALGIASILRKQQTNDVGTYYVFCKYRAAFTYTYLKSIFKVPYIRLKTYLLRFHQNIFTENLIYKEQQVWDKQISSRLLDIHFQSKMGT